MVWLLGFELSCGLESRLESCQQLWAFGVEGKKKSQMNRGKSSKNSDMVLFQDNNFVGLRGFPSFLTSQFYAADWLDQKFAVVAEVMKYLYVSKYRL